MKRSDFEIEICTGNIQSVIAAEQAGADRVELCDNLFEGGTTPSYGTVQLAKEQTTLQVFPIIRLRGGNFVYSENEIEVMVRDIKSFVKLGVDGFAIGCLTPTGAVDMESCGRLISAAQGLPITFHRAFDVAQDPFEALVELKKLGVSRLLTSGQKNKAIDGVKLIKQLVNEADKELRIMAGSGIDETNIQFIAKATGVRSFHASVREGVEAESSFINPEVLFNGPRDLGENTFKVTSYKKVVKLIKIIQEL